MKATITPVRSPEGYVLPGTSFEMEPGELEDIPPEQVAAAAHWCAGMARSMWMRANADLEAMAWVDAAEVPDSPAGLDGGDQG